MSAAGGQTNNMSAAGAQTNNMSAGREGLTGSDGKQGLNTECWQRMLERREYWQKRLDRECWQRRLELAEKARTQGVLAEKTGISKENFGGNYYVTELKNCEVLTSICSAVMPSTPFL